MSTYYDFMVEAKYEGKWYNIDFHTKDIDGKLQASISRHHFTQFYWTAGGSGERSMGH